MLGVMRRPWAAAGFLLMASCGVESTEETLAQHEDIRVVQHRSQGHRLDCAGGHGIGLCWPHRVDDQRTTLHVGERTATLRCGPDPEAELVRDPGRTRVAIRCDATWHVAYLAGANYLGVIAAPEGFDGTAWDDVPSFDEARRALWGEHGDAHLLAALREVGGAAVHDAFVLDLCRSASRTQLSAWHDSVGEVFVDETYRAARAAALTDPDGLEPCVTLYASRQTPALRGASAKAAARRLAEVDPDTWQETWLLWELGRTASGPTAACDWVERQPPGSWTERDGYAVTLAVLAILDGDAACPSLAAFVDPPCPTETVTPPDAVDEASTARFLSNLRRAREDFRRITLDASFVALVHALQTRTTPTDATRTRLHRLTYDATALPSDCAPLRARREACRQPPEQTRVTFDACTFRIDDEHATLVPDPMTPTPP